MPVSRLAFALGAAAMLLPGASSATGHAQMRWRPLIQIHGAFDVVGPRVDGRLIISTSHGLYLYRRGGRLAPFARGVGGYLPAAGETYAALARDRRLPAAGCRFHRDDLYVLDPTVNPGVIKVDKRGRATRLVSFPGAFLAGITFDPVGRFGSNLLVTARVANELTLYAVDCRGRARIVLEHGPQVEGGIAVAPRTFGAFGGRLVAADEFTGLVYAFDERGRHTILANSGLPVGSDVGVEALGFVPKGFDRRARAYISDPAAPGSPTEGTNSVLSVSGADLLRAGVRAGDLLVATESGARTIVVRCRRRCTVRRIGQGPTETHGEGHLTVAARR
jgi:hypothetical protein